MARALRVDRRLDEAGRLAGAAVRDRHVDVQHLQRAHGDAVADRHRRHARRVVVLQRQEDPVGLTGEMQSGARAEAERVEVLVEPLLAELTRDLDRADVRRLTQHVGHRHVDIVLIDVREGLVVDDDRLRDLHGCGRRDETLLDGPGHRHDLVGGTRFVHVGDGTVLRSGGRGLRRRVGRHTGDGRHREDVAGLDVGDDRHPTTRGLRRVHAVRKRRLHLVLQRAVDGQDQVAATTGRLDAPLPTGDRLAVRVAFELHLAGSALERALVRGLETAETLIVGADEAEHRRCKRARRVEAFRLRHVGDAGKRQRADFRDGLVVDLAGDVRERAVVAAEPRRE